jgi:hypothetical protein
MSRTGPEFVQTESELYSDLDLKQKHGEISETIAGEFLELYEFAKELNGRVTIGGAKNANFQFKSDAHQGAYSGDPSVFTANVNGELQIWPAGMQVMNDSLETVGWNEQDYRSFERAFQSLRGVGPDSIAIQFDEFTSHNNINRFKEIVEEFVSTCEEKEAEAF